MNWKPILTVGLSLLWEKLAAKKAKKVVRHVCDALDGAHGDEVKARLAESLAKALQASESLMRTGTHVFDRLDKQAEAARERGKK
jgi:hypothetical protein